MIIVDTYNVLHAIEGLGPEAADLSVPSLGRLVARSRRGGEACVLVCDGNQGRTGPIEGAPNVSALYVGAGKDADSEIERMIAADSAPRRLLVVSSDHRIKRAAEKRRARTMESDAFLRRLLRAGGRPEAKQHGLSAEDEREIIRAFGVDPDEIEQRRAERRCEPESTGDATLDEAVRHFGERLSPEDLDVTKWLDGEDPESGAARRPR